MESKRRNPTLIFLAMHLELYITKIIGEKAKTMYKSGIKLNKQLHRCSRCLVVI